MTQGSSHPPTYLSNSLLTRSAADTTPDTPAPPKDEGTEHFSGMAKKFLAARNDPGNRHVTYEPEPWKPVHYFFYGSLMDEKQLTQVLRLKSPPAVRPASVVGYSVKMWGPYPALIDGPPGNVVNGVVYVVRRPDHEKRLAYYETDAYRCAACFITPGVSGEQMFGKTFVWADDPNDGELSVGSFDFEAWKRARYSS